MKKKFKGAFSYFGEIFELYRYAHSKAQAKKLMIEGSNGLAAKLGVYPQRLYTYFNDSTDNWKIEEVPDSQPADNTDNTDNTDNDVAQGLLFGGARIAAILRKQGKSIDDVRPLATLWYENEKGDKRYLTEEELKNAQPPVGYAYQITRTPELVESVVTDEGEMGRFTTTLNTITPIVQYLINERGWSLVDAIVVAATTCARCLNILLEDATGEVYSQEDRDKVNTYCELCEVIDPEYASWYSSTRP